MSPIRTHYENLTVARNAPLEVIRAAYRVLAQKYHPDRNRGDPDAARVMALLNEAYRVLSDSQLRLEHDQWIRSVEAATGNAHTMPEHARSDVKQNPRSNSSYSRPESGPSTESPSRAPSKASGEVLDLEIEWAKFKSFFGMGTSKRR